MVRPLYLNLTLCVSRSLACCSEQVQSRQRSNRDNQRGDGKRSQGPGTKRSPFFMNHSHNEKPKSFTNTGSGQTKGQLIAEKDCFTLTVCYRSFWGGSSSLRKNITHHSSTHRWMWKATVVALQSMGGGLLRGAEHGVRLRAPWHHDD